MSVRALAPAVTHLLSENGLRRNTPRSADGSSSRASGRCSQTARHVEGLTRCVPVQPEAVGQLVGEVRLDSKGFPR